MANKVYNLNGGLYSGDAFTAFETRIASSNNGSIVASPSDLKVSAGSGMNVTVATGAGIIGNGTLSGVRFAIDAPVTVAVNAASTANPRMDSVVAYIDKSVSASTSVVDNTGLGIIKFKTVAGAPASAPTAPSTATIQSSIGAGNPYMVLANITVPKSSSAASSFTIRDMRVTPTSAIITDSSITTPKLANKAVTSDKVDFTTLLPKLFKTYEMPAVGPVTPSSAWKNYNMGNPMTVTGLDSNATYTLIASTPFTEGKGEFRLKITGATTYQQNLYNTTGALVAVAYQIQGVKPTSSGSLTFQRAYSGEITSIRADKLYITLIRTA